MKQALPVLQPSGFAAWPWRGLLWATVVAVGAHAVALLWAISPARLSLTRPSDGEAMSVRMIMPTPIPASSMKDVHAPDSTASPATVVATPDLPKQTQRPRLATEQLNNIDKNQRYDGLEYEKYATKNIANSTNFLDSSLAAPAPATMSVAKPTTMATSADTSAAPSRHAASQPELKLSYPANAKLLFDGIYMSKAQSQQARGVLSWKMDGAKYEISLEATALVIFSRIEKSEGSLMPQGLAPLRYSSVRTGRSQQATHFRAELGKIQFSNNKPDEILLPGAQDRLSALIQLAGMLGGDPERYKIVDRIQMQVAGLDSAETWEFGVQGEGSVALPAATLQALKLTRLPRSEYDQRIDIWLAPSLGYLPVRIRQSSASSPDQDFTDLMLSRLP
jgi:Protein of unknown function (DUF3108)